jgi:hypothetical protein
MNYSSMYKNINNNDNDHITDHQIIIFKHCKKLLYSFKNLLEYVSNT